jgi:flagellar basal-body rod protein FlgC
MRLNGAGDVVRPLFRALALPASGMSAQRKRLDAIAMNIANAETTRAQDGAPYRRRIVELEAVTQPESSPMALRVAPELPAALQPGQAMEEQAAVRVSGVYQDESEGPLVYDPSHPDADESGYVRYPNVRMEEEMVDLMEARRAYEANATVFQAMKGMLRRALEI